MKRMMGYIQALTRENDDIRRAFEIERALRVDEQWRRLKAEGQCAYMQDRIRRVLGLPGFGQAACERCGCHLAAGERIACPSCLVASGIDPESYYAEEKKSA